jgi:hypothetical protein
MSSSVRPVAKEAKMNKGAQLQEKSGHKPPAKYQGVGGETKADMKGAQEGSPTDKNPLAGAVRELKSQHPHEYHDHGPHHGTTTHIRHQPLGGLKV